MNEKWLVIGQNARFSSLVSEQGLATRNVRDALDSAPHTHDVNLRVNQLLTATINVETRLREVLLSGEEECLAPFDSGRIFR